MGPSGPERTKHLAGGLVVVDDGTMRAVAPNITPDRKTGIGGWSGAEFVRAVTQGGSRDGRPLLPPMGFSYYAGMTAEDLAALVAYLRTLPPSGG